MVKLVHAVGAQGRAVDGMHALDLRDGATAADVVGALDLAIGEDYALIVNDRPLPPERRGGHRLSEGDSIVVLPPLEGG